MIERANIAWGAKHGVFLGVVFAAFAGFVIAMRGGLPANTPITWPVLLAVYLVWGLIGGVIVGAFRSLLKTRVGAIVLVGIALVPYTAFFLHVGQEPISTWSADEWLICLTASFLLASIGVYVFSGE